MTDIATKPLRADARRNRERVLTAARAVFAEHGREAQMDDVARRAGVGVGTVYRHFPTKEALVNALALDLFEGLISAAREALEIEDPWEAFTHALWAGGHLLASDRAFTEIASQTEMPISPELAAELTGLFERLVRRAQDAGVLRTDLVFDDVPMFMCGIGAATAKPHCCPEAWKRHMMILIDGLRATSASQQLPT
jgi:AcrR family transcriptional regulator